MSIKATRGDIVWSYLGTFMKYGLNILILPILLRLLSNEEVGMWYVFSSVGALVNLLDFGFAPTISRNISYCWSGVKSLVSVGIADSDEKESAPNYELLYKVIFSSRRIYLYISTFCIFILLTVANYYISSLSIDMDIQKRVTAAWVIYCAGIFFNMYFSYLTAALIGIGKIKESQKVIIISNIAYTIVLFIGLQYGLGLIALAVAFLVSGLSIKVLSHRILYGDQQFRLVKRYDCKVEKGFYKDTIKIMWHNAYKLGVVSIGTYLVSQSSVLICSKYFGLSVTASYGLSLQIFSLIGGFASVFMRSYVPAMNYARVHNEKEALLKYFSVAIVVSYISYAACGVFVIFFGNGILSLIGSSTPLLSRGFLSFMFLYLFLEFNHGTFATFITTKNEVPYMYPSILSGFAVVIIAFLTVKFTGLGLWGLLFAQFIVQISYNNWKWPIVALKELNISIRELLFNGIVNIKKVLYKEGFV
jgi:O-antigen/teichoic acid export membrane protein